MDIHQIAGLTAHGPGPLAGSSRWRTARPRPRCTYADWTRRISETFSVLRAYRAFACPPVVRPGGGGGAAVPAELPPESAGSGSKPGKQTPGGVYGDDCRRRATGLVFDQHALDALVREVGERVNEPMPEPRLTRER